MDQKGLPRVGRGSGTWVRSMLLVAGAMLLPAIALAEDVPTGGTISISMQDDAEVASPGAFLEAATLALSDKGFTPLDDGHAALVMELAVRSVEVGTGSGKVEKSNPDLMAGGVSGAVGSSFSLPVPSGKTRHVALERTELEMRLHRRGDQSIIWSGSAVTVRPADKQGAAAAALCNALLRAYPEQPEAVIGVP